MKFLNIILVLCLSAVCLELSSQELHVYFDAHSKELVFKKDGNIVKSPKAKYGQQVVFHLQNFNSYIYSAQVEAEKVIKAFPSSSTKIVSDSNPNPFTGLLNFQTGLKLGVEESNQLKFSGFGFALEAEQQKQLTKLKTQYDATLLDMYSAEKQLKFVDEDLENYLNSQEINRIVLDELQKLKYNHRLEATQIKALSLEYLKKVFMLVDSEDITLSDILEKSDSKKLVKGLITKYDDESTRFLVNRSKLNNIAFSLSTIDIDDEEVESWKIRADNILAQAKKTEAVINENKSKLQEIYQHSTQQNLQNLVELRYEYEAILNSDFSESFRFEVKEDELNIKIKLVPNSESREYSSAEIIELPTVKIPVYGKFKINSSMGLSFAGFHKQASEYFVRDSIIGSQSVNKFSPLITSFFHFYAQKSGQLSLGGSFGIGIPLSGQNGLNSVHFLIGPSLIIGKGERLVLSAGILGAKVNKLSSGLKEGDYYEPGFQEIPTYSSYDLGYYIGLSFNLLAK